MPIEILPGTEADLRRCIQIQQNAFSVHPETADVNEALFPGSGPVDPESDAAAAKQLGAIIDQDPNVRFIKAVDTSLSGDEALVGWAKWHIYPEGMTPRPPRQWGKEANIEACKYFFGSMDEVETRLMSDKPCICLRPVMTATEHQRRGIGTKLINWGVELSSSLNLPICLIASPIGHTLYQKCGFKDIEEITLDLSKYGVPEKHMTWAMLRDCDQKI